MRTANRLVESRLILWLRVIASVHPEGLFIGGKSMGGRMSSLIADEADVTGLVCLGCPFHPVGRPDQLRIEHFKAIRTPTLMVQGERDPFGNRQEVAEYRLSEQVCIHWLADGDHSFKPRKASGRGSKLQRRGRTVASAPHNRKIAPRWASFFMHGAFRSQGLRQN